MLWKRLLFNVQSIDRQNDLPSTWSMQIKRTNELLEVMDSKCIQFKLPILSAVVVMDDGGPCTVALQSIERYKLARRGESAGAAVRRIRAQCFKADYSAVQRMVQTE